MTEAQLKDIALGLMPAPWSVSAVRAQACGAGTSGAACLSVHASCPVYELAAAGMLPDVFRPALDRDYSECDEDFREAVGCDPDDDPDEYGRFHTIWSESNGRMAHVSLSFLPAPGSFSGCGWVSGPGSSEPVQVPGGSFGVSAGDALSALLAVKQG